MIYCLLIGRIDGIASIENLERNITVAFPVSLSSFIQQWGSDSGASSGSSGSKTQPMVSLQEDFGNMQQDSWPADLLRIYYLFTGARVRV